MFREGAPGFDPTHEQKDSGLDTPIPRPLKALENDEAIDEKGVFDSEFPSIPKPKS